MDINSIKLPSNRRFGLFFAGIFVAVGLYFLSYGSKSLGIGLFFVGTLFFFSALFKPEVLLPLNKIWMRFGFLLGKIISPIVLGLLFFGIFTPLSVVTRIFGRDELHLKAVNKSSYWRIRDSALVEVGSFKNQF